AFATNGRPYLKQLETKSGIWFIDFRNPTKAPRALQGWMSPTGIEELLEREETNGSKTFTKIDDDDFLRNKDGLNLREYQIQRFMRWTKPLRKAKSKCSLQWRREPEKHAHSLH
ncbi:MAG: hypothetical protein IIU46_02380, partial [Treponema sp.]|nr:hypothetical protein [Treponema sp.]